MADGHTRGGSGHDVDARVAEALASSLRTVRELVEAGVRFDHEFELAVENSRAAAAHDRTDRLSRLDEEQSQTAAEFRRDAGRRSRAAAASLRAAAEQLSPGAAGAAWTAREMSAQMPAGGVPGGVRVGTFSNGAPALLPLVGVPGWVVTGPAAEQLVADAVLRVALSCPPESLRLSVFDPMLRGTLGFTSLFRASDPKGYPPALQAVEHLTRSLAELIDRIGATAEKMSTAGVTDQRDLPADVSGRFELVVLLGAPSGIDDAATAELNRIIRSATGRGVFLIVLTEDYAGGSLRISDYSSLDLDAGLVRVEAGADVKAEALPHGLIVTADPSPDAVIRNNLIQARAEALAAVAQGTLTLEALLTESSGRWSDRGDDGITATFARFSQGTGGLDLRSANPPAPNALIGGAVGTGKSNLLLGLIHALADRYSPWDLRFHLLDFKEGIEFARLAPAGADAWLPHVDSLGLESDREYGVAVLEHLLGEFDRRAEAFKKVGAASLSEYRGSTGTDMPRLVLVADEFQVLFEPDDALAQRAVQLIEHLARKGRAYGVHLVLASQTLSGIQALSLKRDAIFGQFHHRISLRNTEHESESILGPGNFAAADLHGRGRAVFNDELGHPAANRVGTVVWAAPQHLDRLQNELFRRSVDQGFEPIRPRTFVSSAYATWQRSADRESAAVGMPISVDEGPMGFSLASGELGNIAVIGDSPEPTRAVLASLYTSIRESALAPAEWTVVDTGGIRLGDSGPWSEDGATHRIPPTAAAEYLRELVRERPRPTNRIDRVIMLDDPNEIASLLDPNDYDRPMEAVERFIKRSISNGILFVIRFRSVSSYDARMIGELRDGFRGLVLTEPGPQTDLLAPGTGRTEARGPRVVLVHPSSGRQRVLIPFDPETLPRVGGVEQESEVAR